MVECRSRRTSAAGDRLRTPTSTVAFSGTGVLSPIDAHNCWWQCPVAVASDMPGKKPLTDDSEVLKSACASIHTMPHRLRSIPASTPMHTSHDPAKTTGSCSRGDRRLHQRP
jgi:hypothetical protein